MWEGLSDVWFYQGLFLIFWVTLKNIPSGFYSKSMSKNFSDFFLSTFSVIGFEGSSLKCTQI